MWFEPPYTNTTTPIYSTLDGLRSVLSPILLDLSYLIERKLVQGTYKFVKIDGVKIAVLRVYSIPGDVVGNRFLEDYRIQYRRGKAITWHQGKQKTIMKNLLAVLDYSETHWLSPESIDSKILIFSALSKFVPFSSKTLGSGPYYASQSLDNHITRLTKGHPFFIREDELTDDSLENRLADVYNSLSFSLDLTNDYLATSKDIPGLKSQLYNYQEESVIKMFTNESMSKLTDMPQLTKIKKFDTVFYFDSLTMTFNLHSEYYSTPRGGILAENMGLGKTCICLALICLTKHEKSETPERYTITNSHDYQVQSLFDQCVRHINRHSISWSVHEDDLPTTCVEALRKTPGYFYLKNDEMPNRRNLSRARPIVAERKYLLTSATLIVCPDNLFKQWAMEIDKHVQPGFLNVFLAADTPVQTSAMILVTYDIVLMPVSVYSREDPETSELSKIYWKRFIIDEGHSMNQKSTRAVDISRKMKFERRWAVTGTPTSGMTKLHMNERFDENLSTYTIKRTFNAKDDLARLGILVSNFFQIDPWVNRNDLWNKTIAKPFMEGKFNSRHSLEALLNSLIVRHSPEQIDTDVTLPPLHHKPVFLTPSHHNKMSVNLFVAVLAVNAVSSEREDQDYMFHPLSKADLRRLVTNLQRGTFYWTGFSIEDLESLIYIAGVCLEKKNDDGTEYYSPEDMKLLERSIRTCKMALADKNWRTVSTLHEMNYFVRGLSSLFKKNYAINKLTSEISVFGAPQIYSLQSFYFKNRFSKEEALEERIVGFSDEFWKGFWKEATKKNAERLKKNDGQTIDVSKVGEELQHQEKLSLKSHSKMKFEDPNAIKSITGRVRNISSKSATPEPGHNSNMFNRSSRLIGTSSSKLSYMVSKLLEDSFAGTKSIVFFEFEDSAYYLSEALDIVGLEYTLYATFVPKEQRPQKIKDFSDSKGSHTLIMDLKLASHGLTIIAATKVYFLSPVWKRSIEAQAIKRAHRIGQKSPVYVETLILRGTLEEEMYKRRLMAEDELTVPVADDNQIRDYISKFEFLKVTDSVPYAEFKCKSAKENKPINNNDYEKHELLEPSAHGIKSYLHWDIPLFSKGALIKQSEIQKSTAISKRGPKIEKPINTTLAQAPTFSDSLPIKIEVLEERPNKRVYNKESGHQEPTIKDGPPRKKVRFL